MPLDPSKNKYACELTMPRLRQLYAPIAHHSQSIAALPHKLLQPLDY